MWATPTTISFPPSANPVRIRIPILRTNRTEFNSLKLRASFFDYPLASRIIVRNLPYSTSERSLLENFSNFGQIAEVKLIKDKMTRRSKGFAFIQFTSQDDAMLAIENMDHQNLDGRLIYVEIAKPGKDAFGGYLRTSGPPKQQQHLQVLEEAADCWY
ncbi:Glycine-rich RNA-binding protein 2 [Morus notabilis]|uniref:Glycine-rich RNA-binding protein 2 n=1 Tax=Morus notabilis TaxID=981085 RepID=W9RS49_9ROSA|nr:glycine-rich RNA-binding protein 4, mitochondrial [Morus notabilis]EXB66987.1 Glycine-rich RNA-binding protein 2 [Morus notabilis]